MAINLLPPDVEMRVRQDYRRRTLIGIGVLVAGVFLMNGILLIPSWVAFASQEQELRRELGAIQKGSLYAKATELETSARRLNQRIRQYESLEKGATRSTVAIDAALGAADARIRILSMEYAPASSAPGKKARLTLSGEATSRAAFLDFVKTLESNPSVATVESPVSNLLREAKVDYSLVVVFR